MSAEGELLFVGVIAMAAFLTGLSKGGLGGMIGC